MTTELAAAVERTKDYIHFAQHYQAQKDIRLVLAELERQRKALEAAEAALRFYAKGRPSNNDPDVIGTRLEFGCGCCSGTVDNEDGGLDYDNGVQGLTAREVLAKYFDGEAK